MYEISVYLQGQLGNILFQISLLYAMCRKYNKKAVIYDIFTHNSSFNKYKNKLVVDNKIFGIIDYQQTPQNYILKISEHPDKPCVFHNFEDYILNKQSSTTLLFIGYFQSLKYFEEYLNEIQSFILKDVNPQPLDLSLTYFMHIRGGDYVGNPTHELSNLNTYFEKCVMELPFKYDTSIIIFTNDKNYASSFKCLEKLKNKIIIDSLSELDTLYYMSKCHGCICSNSSFSWWGSVLNINRDIYMPYKWFATDRLLYSDVYPPNVKVIKF